MQTDNLVLGVDGGGTKTLAWLARLDGEPAPLGVGLGGPGNFQAVGVEAALCNLSEAIGAAFADAEIEPGPVAAAVVALAGSDRDENRAILNYWANNQNVADRFCVVNDAVPILTAGTPEGWGIGLISGTGSFCFGQDADGRWARAGGWGYLFGDEGSGYGLAVAGLRAAAKAADGRGSPTLLLGGFLKALDIGEPGELVRAVYAIADDRARIATLARVVADAAGGNDTVAKQIIDDGARELAVAVQAVATRLEFDSFPLAVTGGGLCAIAALRDRLEAHLEQLGLNAIPITMVEQPVAGAVRLAQMEARKS